MSTTSKIVAAVIITGLSIGCYFYYQKKNKPSTTLNDDTAEALKKSASGYPGNSSNFKGIYLYSIENDSLYLRTVDNQVYNCGKLSQCPMILSDTSTETIYAITDIVNVYNCAIVPDQYKDQCGGKKTGDIAITLKTASQFEDDLKKKSVGNITPDVSVCYNTIGTSGGDNLFGKAYHSIGDFLNDNKDAIISFATQFGIMEAVGKYMGIWGMLSMIVPGFFSGDKWGRQKTGFMTGQILAHWMIGKLNEFISNSSKDALVEAADGQIARVGEEFAVEASVYLSKESLALFGKVVGSVGDLMTGIGELQMLGMFIDVFDFCGLNATDNNLTQEIFDSRKKISDKLLYIGTSGATYPTIWDPVNNYCDYDLNPLTCDSKYKDCPITSPWASPGTPYKKQTEDEYCKEANDSFTADMNEYLNHLKTNSQGQCIISPDNKALADLFKKYVGGGLDWDSIASVDAKNYPLSLPDNKVLEALNVLLVDKNAIVASYVYQYRYFILAFFIVLMIVMFMI